LITSPDFPLKVVMKTPAGSSKSISDEFRGANEQGKTYTENRLVMWSVMMGH